MGLPDGMSGLASLGFSNPRQYGRPNAAALGFPEMPADQVRTVLAVTAVDKATTHLRRAGLARDREREKELAEPLIVFAVKTAAPHELGRRGGHGTDTDLRRRSGPTALLCGGSGLSSL